MMTTKTFQFELVSAEKALFSGEATLLIAKTQTGELGIMAGHAQLLAALKPSDLEVCLADGKRAFFYVAGGILEVQPSQVTVLSDTVIRAEDLDEVTILAAKERAEHLVAEKRGGIEYAQALTELAEAMAQLQTIRKIRKN